MSSIRMLLVLVGLAAAGLGLFNFMARRNAAPIEAPPEMSGIPQEEGMAIQAVRDVDGPPPEVEEGFEPLLGQWEGRFNKGGWNHYGPGYFTLDPETGVLASHGGMGLFWYAAETFGDFTLRLQFQTSKPESNSGVFIRVPEVPASDDYIYHSFEVQIHATAAEGIHRTGGVYDAVAPSEDLARAPGEWNDMEISFVGDRITVVMNGTQVVDWTAEPAGKVADFAPVGYIGLQNHDWDSSVWFRNIRVKRLD
ncbi:MAG: 3-keto-disaccharide hydrolase [Gemmatimonadota bacterium]